MNTENRCRLGWLAAGMATCLMMSSCRTFHEAQAYSREEDTPALSKAEKEKMVLQIMKDIIIPEFRFAPPDTIIDAVDFFHQASLDYDNPDSSRDWRGFSFILKLPTTTSAVNADDAEDIFASPGGVADVPVIPAMTARNISLYDALKLVCEVTGMKLRIDGGLVMIVPRIEDGGCLEMRYFPLARPLFDGKPNEEVSEAEWKAFFADMEVDWPVGSSVRCLTPSKLRVVNTPMNMAMMEHFFRCKACEDDGFWFSANAAVLQKLHGTIIPEATFGPPATLIDAVDFLAQASREYDSPVIPREHRGLSFILKLKFPLDDSGLRVLPSITARNISLYDLLNLVCDVTSMKKLWVEDGHVLIEPLDDPDSPSPIPIWETRHYSITPLISDKSDGKLEDVLRSYLARCHHNVSWPEGSYVKYQASTGKISIKNTLANAHTSGNMEIIERALRGYEDCEIKDSCLFGVLQKMCSIIIPEVRFAPPSTLIDAVDFVKQASRDYDNPDIPIERRGLGFILILPRTTSDVTADDPFLSPVSTGAPVIPAFTARNISLYDLARLVCDATGMRFRIQGGQILITPW